MNQEIVNILKLQLESAQAQKDLQTYLDTVKELKSQFGDDKAFNDFIKSQKTSKKAVDDTVKSVLDLNSIITQSSDDVQKNNGAIQQNSEFLKDLEKQYKQGKVSIEDYVTAKESAKKANNDLRQANKDLEKQIKSYSDVMDLAAFNSDVENKSLAEKRKTLSDAKQQYAQLKVGVNATAEEVSQFRIQLKILNEEVKRSEEAYGDNQRSVGDYKQSIVEAANSLGIFKKASDSAGSSLGLVASGFGSMNVGINGSVSALKLLKVAVASTGIGLLVVALGSLVSFFTQSEKGSKLLAQGMAVLEGIFSGLTKTLSSFGETIVSAFENPQKAIKDTIDFIKNTAVKVVTDYYKLLFNVVTLDFDSAKKIIKEYTDAAKKGYDAVANSINSTINSTNELIESNLKLLKLQQDTAAASRFLSQEQAKLNAQYQIAIELADDDTKGFQEREKNSKRALALQKQLAAFNIAIAQNNKELADEELKNLELRGAAFEQLEAARQRQAEANIALIQAESEAELQRRDANEKIFKQRSDLFELLLDSSQATTDKLVADIDRQIEKDNLDVENKKRLQQEKIKILNDGFASEVKQIEKFSKKKIDIDRLMESSTEQEATMYLKSLDLNEKSAIRLIDVYNRRKDALLSLNDTEMAIMETQEDIRKRNVDAELELLSMKEEMLRKEPAMVKQNQQDILDTIRESYQLQLNELDLLLEKKLITQKEYDAQKLSLDTETTAKTIELNRQIIESERAVIMSNIEYGKQFVSALGDMVSAMEGSKDEILAFKMGEILVNYATELSALATASASNPLNGATFGGAGALQYAKGFALASIRLTTNLATLNSAFAAGGGEFEVKQPTMMLVGEQGRERISVTPLERMGTSGINDYSKITRTGIVNDKMTNKQQVQQPQIVPVLSVEKVTDTQNRIAVRERFSSMK